MAFLFCMYIYMSVGDEMSMEMRDDGDVEREREERGNGME